MIPKVFISYSWDTKEHEDWVLGLVADLRRAGIDANLDKSITQEGNVNLDKMMINGFKDNDKVILVLTENYAKKADNNKGGVGFETIISLPVLRKNPNKLIPISRHKGILDNSLPFHLQSNYIIDFSNNDNYFDKLTELIHKIREINLIELPEVGEPTDLSPRKIKGHLEKAMDSLIPNLARHDEQDKKIFLIQEMNKIWKTIVLLANKTKEVNPNFTFLVDVDTESEKIIYFKVNEILKTGIHIRINEMFRNYNQICISYGTRFTKGNSSSFNEMITCDVSKDNSLELSGLSFGYFRNNSNSPEDIAKEMWSNQVLNQLKY